MHLASKGLLALVVEEAIAMTGAKGYKAPKASLEMEHDGYDSS